MSKLHTLLKMSVKGVLISTNGALFIIICALLATSFWTTSQQERNAGTINLSGRQRMLSQKMTKELLWYAESRDPATLEALQTSVHVFQETMEALLTGGSAPAELKRDSPTRIAVDHPSPEVKAQLEVAVALWRPLHTQLTRITPATQEFGEVKKQLIQSNTRILTEINKAVFMMSQEAERHVVRLIQANEAGLVLGVITLLFIIVQIRTLTGQIVTIRNRLATLAGGDLTVRIALAGRPNEIDRIAMDINAMAARFADITRLLLIGNGNHGGLRG